MKKNLDYILLGTVIALIVIGILILAGASANVSQEKFGNPFHYLNHQILYGFLLGIISAWIIFRFVSLSFLKKWSFLILIANLALLAMVFIPSIGSGFQQGATRWISIGRISFQPSEFLKISFIIYLACWLKTRASFSKQKSQLGQGLLSEASKTFLIFCTILGITGLFLVLQPDISTFGVIFLVSLIMYFLAGAPFWHLGTMMAGGISSLIILIKVAPYRMNRFSIFLEPELYPMGIGYHLKQSLIAVGSGGWSGLGLGLSRQRFGFLPGTMADSVFAVFAEETGLIGSLILISLFILLLLRGFRIAKRTKDKSLQLIAFGLSSWLVIQAFVNIGAMIGIVPLTGIPLPFISYGGSAIIAELIGISILLKISNQLKT